MCMPGHGQQQSRRWCFTVNNPSGIEPYLNFQLASTQVEYASWQLEMGGAGTRHLQGWIVLLRKSRLGGVKRILTESGGAGAHLEAQRGTDSEAFEYTVKLDTRLGGPWDFGVRPAEASVSAIHAGWDAILTAILGGQRPRELLRGGSIRTSGVLRLADRLVADIDDERKRDGTVEPSVTVITGPTAVGKSRLAFASAPAAFWLDCDPTNKTKFWCGYEGESEVIIDDFAGETQVDWSTFLRWIDRYPMRVQTKGGHRQLRTLVWYITSNREPCQWFQQQSDCAPLYRRIRMWLRFSEPDHGFLNGYPDSSGYFVDGPRSVSVC